MMEKIYTIPVNEAFDECAADHSMGCPFCRMREKLEENELDLILGASMMEPDIRIKTNELGFCHSHYDKMFVRKNRLGLGLMLESHLDEVRKSLDGGMLTDLMKGKGAAANDKLTRLEETCYVCGRIDFSFRKMVENAVYLWEADDASREKTFERKIQAQPYFCLPHYNAFLSAGRDRLQKKKFNDFHKVVTDVVTGYFDELRGDVSWFCKKFDYRYENEDWGNSKDAIERAIKFLCGRD